MHCDGVVEEVRPVIPEGVYEGRPVEIRRLCCCYGNRILIDFVVSGDPRQNGQVVSGIADEEINENTKLGHWIAAILGREPQAGETITADDLLHRECRLVIRDKTQGLSRVFSAVVDVLPAGKAPVI